MLRTIIDLVGVNQIVFGSDAPITEPAISNKWFIDIMKSLPDDSTDGLVFTQEEIDAIMGQTSSKILNI
jgi:predicted TIM-barrel fold metal-dependent hydrolase